MVLSHSQARSLAEARWGRGGTSSEPTNRPGAFYFSCSGHGGFVTTIPIPGLEPELVTVIINNTGKVIKCATRRSMSYYPSRGQSCVEIPVYFAEEDCDWCLVVIHLKIWPDKLPQALDTYWKWFDPTNPKRNNPWLSSSL